MQTPFKFTVTSLIVAHNLNSDRVAKSQGHEERHLVTDVKTLVLVVSGDPQIAR
jgi:hypothetical protein